MNTESERHYLSKQDNWKIFLTRDNNGKYVCFEGFGKTDSIKISRKSWKKLRSMSLYTTMEKSNTSIQKKEFIHEVFKCLLDK